MLIDREVPLSAWIEEKIRQEIADRERIAAGRTQIDPALLGVGR